MQERQETTRITKLIDHKDDAHFIINMNGLHNAARIRKILPRHLSAPKPLYADRRARHYEIAGKLRVTQAEKREQTKAKAKATRDAKKVKKYQQEGAVGTDDSSESEEVEDESAEESDNSLGGNYAHASAGRTRSAKRRRRN